MGTHPIFESDFDCLTDTVRMPNRIGGGGAGSSLTAPVDYITSLFWGIVNFVVIFFSTMLNMEPPGSSGGRSGGRRTGGGNDGPGGSGGGGRRLGTMNDF